MKIYLPNRSIIRKGDNWKHKKTGKIVSIIEEPETKFSGVRLLHQSGRITQKKQHYFLYDYELIQE